MSYKRPTFKIVNGKIVNEKIVDLHLTYYLTYYLKVVQGQSGKMTLDEKLWFATEKINVGLLKSFCHRKQIADITFAPTCPMVNLCKDLAEIQIVFPPTNSTL